MTIQIKDMTVSQEMNKSDLSAVRGAGLCVNVQGALKDAAAQGPAAVIDVAAQCLHMILDDGTPVCPA
jgi:hypothetical protein